jgi:hypothetical protein
MSDNEERRVKARHDVTQFYQRKKDVSRKEMPRGVMTISGDPNLDNSSSNSDDDIEDDTYVPSPRARPHGKGVASACGSGAGRNDEIEEEAEEGADDGGGEEEEEEVFDVKEINRPNYVDMGPLVLRAPTNPSWRVKVSYKGKTESVRENRRILARTQPRDAYDYRFHSLFQQVFYESVIMTKSKPVANFQWIDWTYMENKHDLIFDGVIVACQAKHLREILAFKKDWNNEVIAQFYATVCFKEHGDTRKIH